MQLSVRITDATYKSHIKKFELSLAINGNYYFFLFLLEQTAVYYNASTRSATSICDFAVRLSCRENCAE
jgi:hypothetical protein